LYSELSRSIASTGHPLVRGGASHFPALLQPLLTAPAWFADDVATAYRLAQAIDATVMALAAIPVYVLARRLALGHGWAPAAAAFTRRLRVQLPVLGALGVAALAAAAVGPGRGLGYYRGALGVHVDPVAAATSAGRNLFVLALACGWVIVPGALVGFATARSR